KKIRLQGGWAKTERDRGKYDWRWLDRIIGDARSRGLEILLQTNYGNPIYPGGGSRHLAGGFPTSEEALAAWDKWVEAMATRYKGKVRDWEMWNEPNLNKAHTAEITADFNIRTAEIIKRVIPDARIAGGVLFSPDVKYAERWLKRVTERKKESLFTWFIYHGYTRNPDEGHYENVEKLKALFQQRAPHIRLWQGEAGAQSEFCREGALSKYPWTELTQAKWNTRRMLGDLGHDVESLVFPIADLDYNRWDDERPGHMDRY
ncbi:MAG: beta-galactosidase, partial [Verrucomicrobiae bacterium]|nr:beta-galactosidase [Verrucomicrobiae bacterium]